MDIEDIHLRRVRKSDLDKIMEVERSCFDQDIIEDKEIFKQRLDAFESGFILLEVNDDIAGYICCEKWNYQISPSKQRFELGHDPNTYHDSNGEEIYISSFGIVNKYRGLGIGRIFFERFLKLMKNENPSVNSFILAVSQEWKTAYKIYKTYGFEELFRTEGIFENQKAIIMRKQIKRLQ